MASFDDFARLAADDIRKAAAMDRPTKSGDYSAQEVGSTNVVASLKSIAQLFAEMRDPEKRRIMELTAQRLGVDHEKLKIAFDAAGSKTTHLATEAIQHLIDEAN